ncbi:MAG: hypothetical protein GC188_10265 [Alphaproteobacteria bacterium]|nr:hypothetical protein [Alphaproteobacteria bacterium]
MIGRWLADKYTAIKRRFAAPRLFLADRTLVYIAGGNEQRMPFDEIQRIDAYPGMTDASFQWAVVYTGSRDKITILESTENFIPVFDAVLEHLGMNGPETRTNLVSMSPYDGKNQMKRMVYQRQASTPTV